jgi:hypothetical protein
MLMENDAEGKVLLDRKNETERTAAAQLNLL